MECHEFDIEVRPDGMIRIQTHGVKGPACIEYVKLFEQIMGATGDVERTGEYYEPPTQVGLGIEQRAHGRQ